MALQLQLHKFPGSIRLIEFYFHNCLKLVKFWGLSYYSCHLKYRVSPLKFKLYYQSLVIHYLYNYSYITTTKFTSLQVLIGTNLVLEAGMLLYTQQGTQNIPNQAATRQTLPYTEQGTQTIPNQGATRQTLPYTEQGTQTIPNQGADAQVIVPAVLIPVLFILLGSITVVVFIVLVFRRKIKAKELENKHLSAKMSALTDGGNRDGFATQ